jgi:hypothetical protein
MSDGSDQMVRGFEVKTAREVFQAARIYPPDGLSRAFKEPMTALEIEQSKMAGIRIGQIFLDALDMNSTQVECVQH